MPGLERAAWGSGLGRERLVNDCWGWRCDPPSSNRVEALEREVVVARAGEFVGDGGGFRAS